jgi:hypothetical protein
MTNHKLLAKADATTLCDRYPHRGDCTETLCPECGCCTHCLPDGSCGCGGCTDAFCECATSVQDQAYDADHTTTTEGTPA